MGSRGVIYVFRQICLIFLLEETKESFEDIEGGLPSEEGKPSSDGGRRSEDNVWVRSGRLLYPTSLSVVFVRYTNMLVLPSHSS